MSLENLYKVEPHDPTSFSNSRAEFPLRAVNRRNNWMLKAGVYDTQLTGAEGAYYPTLIGAWACIRRAYIASGSKEIETHSDVAERITRRLNECSNQVSEDLNRQRVLSGNGFTTTPLDEVETPGCLTLSAVFRGYYNTLGPGTNQCVNNQVQIATSSDGQRGLLDLRLLFDFLNDNEVIPAMPDLKLVIEFETRGSEYFLDPNNAGSITSLSPLPMRPELYCLEQRGEVKMVPFSLPFSKTIVEKFNVPATNVIANADVPKKSSFQHRGLTGYNVQKMTYTFVPSSELDPADRWLTRRTRSAAQKQEVIRIKFNEENILPYTGINNQATKYMHYNDTHRPLNFGMFSGMTALRDASGNVLGDDTEAMVGQNSYTAVDINAVANRVFTDYERLHGPEASSQEAGILLVESKVSANLDYKPGSAIRITN